MLQQILSILKKKLTDVLKIKTLIKQIFLLQIGIIGNEKNGKTYFLSQLIDQNISHGYLVTTQGIHFIHQHHTPFVYMDTQGLNRPTKSQANLDQLKRMYDEIKKPQEGQESQKNENVQSQRKNSSEIENNFQEIQKEQSAIITQKQELYDKSLILEELTQRFVMSEADFLIVVVGQMTQEEELMINYLMKLQKARQLYRLIVVHNFQHLTEIEQVSRMIEKDIRKCFRVTWKSYDIINNESQLPYCYQDFTNSYNNPVYHFVFAHTNSEAGSLFNLKSIRGIKNLIQYIDIDINNTLSIEELFANFMSNKSHFFLEPLPKYLYLDPQQIQKSIEQDVLQISRKVESYWEKNGISTFRQKTWIANNRQRKVFEARQDNLAYNYQTFFVPDIDNHQGHIVCPLFQHDAVKMIRKKSDQVITSVNMSMERLGQTQISPQYIALDNYEEITFLIDIASSTKLEAKIRRKINRGHGNEYLQIRGLKQISEKLSGFQRQHRSVQSQQENITQGQININIELRNYEEQEYYFKEKNIKKQYHPNGIYEVIIPYKRENNFDDDD